jgi:hypothetical protein
MVVLRLPKEVSEQGLGLGAFWAPAGVDIC